MQHITRCLSPSGQRSLCPIPVGLCWDDAGEGCGEMSAGGRCCPAASLGFHIQQEAGAAGCTRQWRTSASLWVPAPEAFSEAEGGVPDFNMSCDSNTKSLPLRSPLH